MNPLERTIALAFITICIICILGAALTILIALTLGAIP